MLSVIETWYVMYIFIIKSKYTKLLCIIQVGSCPRDIRRAVRNAGFRQLCDSWLTFLSNVVRKKITIIILVILYLFENFLLRLLRCSSDSFYLHLFSADYIMTWNTGCLLSHTYRGK